MQKSLQVWQFIYNCLQQATPAILLYVVESKGSSPGRQGFFMAVNRDGEMEGSIGGGIMEHKFVEMAKEQLRQTDEHTTGGSIKKQIHDKSAGSNQSGMICSGEQTIILLSITEKDETVVKSIISSLQQNKNGTLTLSPGFISFEDKIPAKNYEFQFHAEQEWIYREKTGYKQQLFIVGGGHCALAFSKLMQDLDFYITLYEERENLNTLVKNEFVHEKLIVDDYSALGNLIPSGPDCFIVIMTFGYRTDAIALRSLLQKQYRYLGVLGSKTKMEKLFDEFRIEGIDEAGLQNIYTPIGVSINSQTPAEIAVSIAAQIIQVKNRVV
ncbi:MAG TPA: XdhC family protein [Chitinophagaceae bacterium]|nr:XdhC family protein [Chitinophagaceae bacterium]HMX76608.1 XdhC family protein [Chitinophagaceae bacterium]HNJ26321.1 XdhC family protein [Chitinophagaceae bacterium]HNJ55384.1 XdhC family protein [Chitinophagaceae bacterium]HNL59225.1 XdhC family protein [Chitinophagaceae bacterium]